MEDNVINIRTEGKNLVAIVLKSVGENVVVKKIAEEHDIKCQEFCGCGVKTTDEGVEIRIYNKTRKTAQVGYMWDKGDERFKKLKYKTGNGDYGYHLEIIDGIVNIGDEYQSTMVEIIPDFKLYEDKYNQSAETQSQ